MGPQDPKDVTRDMVRDLTALIVAGVLMACAAGLLALSEKAEATFPGKNGRIAYSTFGERTDDAIYMIDPGGGAKTKVTRGYQVEDLKDDRRVAADTPPSSSPSSASATGSPRPAKRSTSRSPAWGPTSLPSPTRGPPSSGW